MKNIEPLGERVSIGCDEDWAGAVTEPVLGEKQAQRARQERDHAADSCGFIVGRGVRK